MDRLTVNSDILDGRYELKCLVSNDLVPEYKGNCRDYCEGNADCEFCGIREAFDRLAAYEDTGLSPKEIKLLQEYKVEMGETLNVVLAKLKGMIGKDGENNG